MAGHRNREHLLSKTPLFHSFLATFPIHITPGHVPVPKSICLTHHVNNTSKGARPPEQTLANVWDEVSFGKASPRESWSQSLEYTLILLFPSKPGDQGTPLTNNPFSLWHEKCRTRRTFPRAGRLSWSPEGYKATSGCLLDWVWPCSHPQPLAAQRPPSPSAVLPLLFWITAPPSTEVFHLPIAFPYVTSGKKHNPHTELPPRWLGQRSLSKQHSHRCWVRAINPPQRQSRKTLQWGEETKKPVSSWGRRSFYRLCKLSVEWRWAIFFLFLSWGIIQLDN